MSSGPTGPWGAVGGIGIGGDVEDLLVAGIGGGAAPGAWVVKVPAQLVQRAFLPKSWSGTFSFRPQLGHSTISGIGNSLSNNRLFCEQYRAYRGFARYTSGFCPIRKSFEKNRWLSDLHFLRLRSWEERELKLRRCYVP